MRIEKIKQLKPDFNEKTGPSESVTIGFKVGCRSFILGTSYAGPHMIDEHWEEFVEIEKIVDYLVDLTKKEEIRK